MVSSEKEKKAELTLYPYFKKKAEELGNDEARILEYVKSLGVEPDVGYKGEMRGALGTLWAEGGSAADKALLLKELLLAAKLDDEAVQASVEAFKKQAGGALKIRLGVL